MGVIRKTLSIGTLGMVNFRSKKEKLERANRKAMNAMRDRDAEHLAREVAESGFAKVEAELRRLTDAEAKAARQLARLRRRSRKVRKAEKLSGVLAGATPVMKDVKEGVGKGMEKGMEKGREMSKVAAEVSRTQGRKARKAARKASHELRVGAEKVIDEARSVLAES